MQRHTDDTNGARRRRAKYMGGRASASYVEHDAEKVLGIVETLCQMGAAVRFGKSRDGGALAVGIYGDEDTPYTDFLRPGDSLVDYLDSVRESMLDSRMEAKDTPAKRQDAQHDIEQLKRDILASVLAEQRKNGHAEGSVPATSV